MCLRAVSMRKLDTRRLSTACNPIDARQSLALSHFFDVFVIHVFTKYIHV